MSIRKSHSSSRGSRGARVKGYIKNVKSGEIKKFMYNPQSFSDSQTVNYTDILSPGCSYPLTQFVNGAVKKITLELFLYDKQTLKVPEYIKFLEGFLPQQGVRFSAPSPLIFVFGTYIETCVMEQIDKDYLEFDKNLVVTHATVKLTLRKV